MSHAENENNETENNAAEAAPTDARAEAVAQFLRETEGEFPITRVGPALMAFREQMGISLAQVSADTRLRLDYLTALEGMTLKMAPSYVRMYLGAYARYLELPAETLITRYEQQCGALAEAPEHEIDTTPKNAIPKQMQWLTIAVASVLFVGAVTIFGIDMAFSKSADEETALAEAEIKPVNAAQETLFDEAELARIDAAAKLPLELVAVRKGWVEIRGADGTVFRSRTMSKGESYKPRIGVGWTVQVRDGGAFVWRVEDTVLGALGPDDTPVYALSVDRAAQQAMDTLSPVTATAPESSKSR